MLKDLGDIIDEAHIEHSVRFVEDDMLYPTESNFTAIQEIQNAARGADDHLGTLSKLQ